MSRFRTPRWLWCGVAAWLAIALASQVQSAWASYDHLSLLDLQVYRMGGRALLDRAPLYEVTYPWDSLPFTYTPFAAMLFVPLALLSPGGAALVMTGISVACGVRSVVLIGRCLPPRAGAAIPTVVIGLAIGASLWPARSTFEFGQVNLVILWLVLEDLVGAGRRSRWAGTLLGIAIGIKLTPAFFVLFLLSIRQVRRAVVAIFVAAATVAVGFLVEPDQAWEYWTRAAYDPSRTGSAAYVNNQSWNGVISRLTGSTSHLVLWLALAVPTTIVVLWLSARLWRRQATMPALCVVAIGALLVSPISWSHHWVWFLPMLMVLIQPLHEQETRRQRGRRWALAALVAAVSFPRVIFLVPFGADVEYDHNAFERVIANCYVWVALAFLAYLWAALPSSRTAASDPAHREAGAEPAAVS
jgi:alpha-1,2-mannosyltransferase